MLILINIELKNMILGGYTRRVKITDGEGTVETKTSDALTISESEAPHHLG